MTKLHSLFVAFLLALASFACRAEKQTEIALRADVSARVSEAFASLNFELLEDLEKKYRDPMVRTPTGLPYLTLFQSGIEAAMFNIHGPGVETDRWAVVELIVHDWIAKYPKSPAAHLTEAEIKIRRGWEIRGDDLAKDVNPEAWKPFQEFIAAGRKYLEMHKAEASIDPRWYSLMIEVARSQGWKRKEFEQLLNEALARYPHFSGIYFEAADYLLPKWHGSWEDVERFADEAARRTQDLEGRSWYTRVYTHLMGEFTSFDTFKKSLADWKKMKAGFEDIVKLYPDLQNINLYALYACEAGDKEQTKKLMAVVGNKPIMEVWQYDIVVKACRKQMPIDSMIKCCTEEKDKT